MRVPWRIIKPVPAVRVLRRLIKVEPKFLASGEWLAASGLLAALVLSVAMRLTFTAVMSGISSAFGSISILVLSKYCSLKSVKVTPGRLYGSFV